MDPIIFCTDYCCSVTSDLTKVFFICEAKLDFGESLFLVGNNSSLGFWKHKKGIELFTTPEEYPIWRTKEAINFARDAHIEYKYCIYSGGSFLRWESIDHNRIIEPHDDCCQITDCLDSYKSSGLLSKTYDQTKEVKHKIPPPIYEYSPSNNDHLIIMTLHLPIYLYKDNDLKKWSFEWNESSTVPITMRSFVKNKNYRWIGCVQTFTPITDEDIPLIKDLLKPYNLIPIFMNKNLFETYYYGYCKSYIWPIIHNVVNVYGDYVEIITPVIMNKYWKAFRTANKVINDILVENIHGDEYIWIIDYPLLLIPTLLRHKIKQGIKIGYIFFSPFPSSELFGTIKDRSVLINSLLQCDLIAFSTYSYTRHFLHACHRLMSANTRLTNECCAEVEFNGRFIPVYSAYCGLDFDIYNETIKSVSIDIIKEDLLHISKGRTIIGSIDTLEKLSGIHMKLNSLLIFFEKYGAEYKDKICILLFVMEGECRVDDIASTEKETLHLIEEINKYQGEEPIIYYIKKPFFSLEERIALWSITNIYFTTSIHSGVSIMPLEYCYIHKLIKPLKPGVILLSESSGGSRLVNGGIRVNPWRINEISSILHYILNMPIQEKILRQLKNEETFDLVSVSEWSKLLCHLIKQKKMAKVSETIGLGLDSQLISFKTGFRHIQLSDIIHQYNQSNKRLILLGYGGTLLPSKWDKSKNVLKFHEIIDKVNDLLRRLSNQLENRIFIVSGRAKEEIQESLGDLKSIGLSTENGFTYRLPYENDWRTILMPQYDNNWKKVVYQLMSFYTQRTNGSILSIKGCSVVWDYKNADPDFGPQQSKFLIDLLKSYINMNELSLIVGADYLEVRPKGIDKGSATNNILDLMNTKCSKIDFILCIGNDDNDESMYESVKSYCQKNIESTCYTVTIGQKYSKADYYLNDSSEIMSLLEGLAKLSRSVGDLFGNSFNSLGSNKKCVSELFTPMKDIIEGNIEENNDSDVEEYDDEYDDTLCLI